MDYVADHIGGVAYSLAQANNKGRHSLPEFTPYSQYAHTSRKKRKTDNMSAQEILQYISDKL